MSTPSSTVNPSWFMNELTSGGPVSLWRYNGSFNKVYQFTVDSSGFVGIGTTAPTALLDVRNQNTGDYPNCALQAYMPNSYSAVDYSQAVPVAYRLRWYSDTWDVCGIRGGSTAFAALGFRYNNSEKMTITVGGNVGIGTSSPETLFHVYGTTMIHANTTGDPGVGRLGSVGTSLILWPGDSTNTPFALGCNDGLWYGTTSGYPHKFFVGTSEVMRIASNGAVWAKSTSTTSGFVVSCADVTMTMGNVAGSSNAGSIQVKSNGSFLSQGPLNYHLCLNPNGGAVGIGTTAPTSLFHIQSSTGGTMILSNNAGSSAQYIVMNTNATAGRMFIGMDDHEGFGLFGTGDPYGASVGTPNATSLSFATSNVVQAKIGSDGDVIVGPLVYARRQANFSVYRSGNASMAIVSGSENSSSTLYLATPNMPNTASNNPYKTAIIAQPSGSGWSTANLHFCLRSILGTDGHLSNDPAVANATVSDAKLTITHDGLVGVRRIPTNIFDVQAVSRTGTHPTGRPLYVTGDMEAAANGCEFRHTNGTQGIGIGYGGIYGCGTGGTHEGISLVSQGTNGTFIRGQTITDDLANPKTSLQVEGSTAFDGGNYVNFQCQASAYGRNQVWLTGRLEGSNDGWSFAAGRNALMFRTQSSLNSAVTNRWTIQNFGQALGFLCTDGGDNPVTMLDGRGRVYFQTITNTPVMQILGGESNVLPGNGAVHIKAIDASLYSGRAQDPLTLIAQNDANIIVSCFASDNVSYRGGIYGVNTSSIRFDTSSDYRLKENIHELTGALDIVTRLRPVHFQWKCDQHWDFGLIAQEVYQVLPHMRPFQKSYLGPSCTCEPNEHWEGRRCDYCVSLNDEPVDTNGKLLTYSLDYSKFTPYLIRAIQEQQATIQEQQARIQTLEGTVQEQQARIQTLEATIQDHQATIQDHQATIQDHQARLQTLEGTVQALQATIQTLQGTV